MKKIVLLLLLIFTGTQMICAQEDILKPVYMQPSYFDISPPLRDMILNSDNQVDLSWKDGIVKNKLNAKTSGQVDEITDQTYPDPTIQHFFGDIITDTTQQNFEGVGSNGFYPPDTDGDVGPNHYFQVVNVRFAVYNKNGVKIMGPSNNSTIFSGLPNNSNDGDAIVLYDENADRWLFSQFSLPNYPNGPFYENVAISQTSDPTGSWYRYQFTFSDMPDYPKLSVWGNGYFMTIRRFSSGSGQWIGPAAVAMDRTKMLAGDPTAGMVMYALPSSSEGPLTADCDSEFPPAGTPCPVCYLTSNSVKLYEFSIDWSQPNSSSFINTATIPITMFYTMPGNLSITQKGTSQKLDAFSRKGIMFRMPLRVFPTHWSMLLNTTVNVSGVAGIRWMELRKTGSTWALHQEGTYAPGDGHHRWMGSIAMDSAGNIALGYSVSSTNLFPSIRYTGRMANDPLGQMTIAEKGIFNGGGSQTNIEGRWGDYSAMAADPSEPGKFWYTQEYYSTTSNSNWKTRVASFSFSNIFSTTASASPNPVCVGDSAQLTVSAYGGSGNYTFSWTSVPPGFTSTLQNPKVAPAITTKYVVTSSDGSSTRVDTVLVNVATMPSASAGADTIVCWYVTSVNLHGSASNFKVVGWTTSGSGTFSSSSQLNTIYYPSLADKVAGSVNLNLVAIANLPCVGNTSSTKKVTFDVCTGSDMPVSGDPVFTLQPNPAKDFVTFTASGKSETNASLTIRSLDGKIVRQESFLLDGKVVTSRIDLSGFAAGVYVVQFSAGGKVITRKLNVY